MTVVQGSLQRRIWLAFLITGIIALFPAWLIYANDNRVGEDQDEVERSHATMHALTDMFVSLQEIRAGARAYALSGDPSVLVPYAAALDLIDGQLDELDALVDGNAARGGQLATLRELAERRVSISRQAVEIRDQAGPGPAQQYVLMGEGDALMADIRLLIDNIREEEVTLLQRRQLASDDSTRQTLLLSAGFATISLILVGVILFVAGRALGSRHRAIEAASHVAAIVEASSDAIMSVDVEGVITSWNAGAEAIFGYSAAEAIGQHISLIAAPEEKAAVHANVALLRDGRRIVGQQNRRQAKDGHPVDISLSASPIFGASGEIVGMAAILRDITEQRQVEQALRESERQLATVVRTSPIGVCTTRVADGTILDMNDDLLGRIGYAREEVLGQTMSGLGLWPDAGPIAEVERQLEAEGLVRHAELVCRARSGRPLQVITSWSRIIIGGELCTVVLVDDRTAERTIERDNERIFTLSSDLIAVAGFDGYIRRMNPAACVTTGYSEEEAQAIAFLDLVHPDEREAAAATFGRLAAGDAGANTWEGRLRCKDGSYRWLAVVASPDADRQLFYTVARDVSQRREIEDALQAARAAADEANRAKSHFLSRMSHELRTPLNVVLGFGQVLQLDPLEPDQSEAVEHILTAGRHLLSLIDEVLDISRIESGRISLSIEPLRASEVLSDSVTLMGTLAAERNIELHVGREDCDEFVLADRARLKQVIMNLLSNAIKYNHRGGKVEISCEDPTDGYQKLVISDTGMGIAADKLARLFTPFDRLGVDATGVEGTGLGLSLSRNLIESMNGRIGVESTPGVGSTFWVELPVAEDAPREPEAVLDGVPGSQLFRAGSRTILYIEDNLANLNLMERILMGRQGNRLLAAMQGSLGLQLARDQHPDLVLLDLHLPDMGGDDVLRELQADPATRDIPVVIISADATPGQVARLVDAGARAYLTKPIDVRQLLSMTETLLGDDA